MKKILTIICVALFSVAAMAQEATQETDFLSIDDIVINPGEELEIGIKLTNAEEYYEALQCNIALPEGLEFVKAYGTTKRPAYIKLSNRCEDMDITSCNIASYGDLAGSLAVVLTTDPGLAIYGNEGVIFYIKVKANEETHVSSEIVIKNALLTEGGTYTSHYLPNATANVTKPSNLADYVDDGVTGKPSIINESLTCVYISSDGLTMYVKDDNGYKAKSENASGAINFMEHVGLQKDYDQSNWLAVELPSALSDKDKYLNHKLTDFTGIWRNDNGNCYLAANKIPKEGDNNDYQKNIYIKCNFIGNLQTGRTGKCYFFVTPKPMEIAEITWAVWSNVKNAFVVPESNANQNNSGLDGGFYINSNLLPTNFNPINGATYNFVGLIRHENAAGSDLEFTASIGGDNAKISTDYVVYPLEMLGDNGGIITGIQDLNVNKEEDNTFYNLLGQPVSNPGPGIYIHNGKKVIIRDIQ